VEVGQRSWSVNIGWATDKYNTLEHLVCIRERRAEFEGRAAVRIVGKQLAGEVRTSGTS